MQTFVLLSQWFTVVTVVYWTHSKETKMFICAKERLQCNGESGSPDIKEWCPPGASVLITADLLLWSKKIVNC